MCFIYLFILFYDIYSIQLLSKSNSTTHIQLCFNQEDEVIILFLYPTIIQVQKIEHMYKYIFHEYMSSFLFIKKHDFFPFILLLFFNFLGRGGGITLYLFMLYYIVVRSTAHFFRFSNNLNCVEEIIKSKKKKKKSLTQCTKLLLLCGRGKIMVNNFIYFKHTEQSNISFYKENIFVKLDFSTVLL